MSTKTKKHIKHDIQWLPAEIPPPEPKTLLECYEEAGGFPFVAQALLPNAADDHPLLTAAGVEVKALRFHEKHPHGLVLDCHPYVSNGVTNIACAPIVRRWTLVGHKT